MQPQTICNNRKNDSVDASVVIGSMDDAGAVAQLTDEDLTQILEEAEYHEKRIAELEKQADVQRSTNSVLEAQLKAVKGELAMLQGKHRQLTKELEVAVASRKETEAEMKTVGEFRLIELHEKEKQAKQTQKLEKDVELTRTAAEEVSKLLESERRSRDAETNGLRQALRAAGRAQSKLDGQLDEHNEAIAALQMELYQRRAELLEAQQKAKGWEDKYFSKAKELREAQRQLAGLALSMGDGAGAGRGTRTRTLGTGRAPHARFQPSTSTLARAVGPEVLASSSKGVTGKTKLTSTSQSASSSSLVDYKGRTLQDMASSRAEAKHSRPELFPPRYPAPSKRQKEGWRGNYSISDRTTRQKGKGSKRDQGRGRGQPPHQKMSPRRDVGGRLPSMASLTASANLDVIVPDGRPILPSPKARNKLDALSGTGSDMEDKLGAPQGLPTLEAHSSHPLSVYSGLYTPKDVVQNS